MARDPGRIQALLCVSLSNNHQILNSNEKQAQAPLIESLLLHPFFTVLLSCGQTFQVVTQADLSSKYGSETFNC